MKVAEHVANLLELDQNAEIWFVQGKDDQLIYIASFLPNNKIKVCMVLPTAIDKREIKSQEKQ